jgi:CheY-like chemotaxis protein/HPt (histidine-containing phosphotransfer) domain-containing protein
VRSVPSSAPFPRREGGEGVRSVLHFAVRDTGIGIPADRLSRLFQPFTQADASTTRKYGGTGLGLAVSKRLTELMNGEMWVESVPGRGSTFHFTIAAEPAALEPRAPARGPSVSLDAKRLLVVDDNATNRRIVQLQARSWGMLVRETASPHEALGWIQRGDPFDVAILDMQMPELDGIALGWEIRQARDARTLPLVLLSSLGRHEVSAGRDNPFAAVLTKPIKPSMLYDVLAGIFVGDASARGDSLTLTLSQWEREQHPGVLPTENVSEGAVLPSPSPGAPGEGRGVRFVPPGAPGEGRGVRFDALQPGRAVGQTDATLAERHPLRILLAEDNSVNQQLALLLLGRMGYRADVAANGLEALEAVERQPYDVILMDVQMPEMDGLEASRRLCQRYPVDRRPRIVAMTANAMQGDREMCLAAGMDDYVAKPIRVEELTAALAKVSGVGDRVSGEEPHPRASSPGAPGDEASSASPSGRGRPRPGEGVAETPDGSSDIERQVSLTLTLSQREREQDRPHLRPLSGREGTERGPSAADTASSPSPARLERGRGGEARPPDTRHLTPDTSPLSIDQPAFNRLRAALAKAPPGALTKLLETFYGNAPTLVAEMRRGVASGAADGVRRAAHTLKSNAASFGALELSEQCRELEAQARAGSLDGAAEKVDGIEAEYERAKRELMRLVRDG